MPKVVLFWRGERYKVRSSFWRSPHPTISNWQWFWWGVRELPMRIRLWFAHRYCERHGHDWGRSGTSYIPGEPTVHWAECRRCGFSDSD